LPGRKFSSAGTEGGGPAVKAAYQISAFPTVILIAPNKNIVERDIWPISNGQYLAGVVQGHGGIPASCPAQDINEINNITSSNIALTYPNPAIDIFTMQINVTENASISFEVMNMIGAKVMEIPAVDYTSGIHKVMIPVSELANGSYMVHMFSNKVKRDMCKMIVVK